MTLTKAGRLAALLAVTALPAPWPATSAAQPAPGLPVWLAGCWAGGDGAERFHERWSAPDDRALVGVGYTVKGGRMTAFDYFRVVVRDGHAVYIAQPGGAPPTEFVAASATSTEVVFENLAHDYPKRIGYQRVDAAHLTAWVDGGTAPGAGPRVTFAMQRAGCEP